jgi:hypothetical protein
MAKTYYEILGVAETASAKEIKEAHRRLIFQYHPDRNKDPKAEKIAASINEAYVTLSDARKRVLYDEKLKLRRNASAGQSAAEEAAASSSEPRPETIPDYKCERCDCRDPSIRLTVFHYVFSAIFVTQRHGKAGIWCSKCRAFLAAKWSLFTAAFGWWGFPWGPIYSVGALINNARGGEQPSEENATILKTLSYKKYRMGDYKGAYWAMRESLRLSPDPNAKSILDHLSSLAGNVGEQPSDFWKFVPAAPTVAVGILIALIIRSIVTAPSGYEARYKSPVSPVEATTASVNATRDTKMEPERKRVNALIDRLAEIVDRRAPVVKTTYEGRRTTRHHVLDRSKFDYPELKEIADSIYEELKNHPDSDGFMASSYFNARILALSVDIVNRIDNGSPIEASAIEVLRLGEDEHVINWLNASPYREKYQDLCGRLSRYRKQYVPGRPLKNMVSEWESLDQQCKSMRAQLEGYKSAGDHDSFNESVGEYNILARKTNSLTRQLQLRTATGQKLDLAFNRCIDTGIIMSKFNTVDLTSHAAEVDAAPEPGGVK